VAASFLYMGSRHHHFGVDGLLSCAGVHVRLCHLRQGQVAEAYRHDVRIAPSLVPSMYLNIAVSRMCCSIYCRNCCYSGLT
jgi:hypothetical protein